MSATSFKQNIGTSTADKSCLLFPFNITSQYLTESQANNWLTKWFIDMEDLCTSRMHKISSEQPLMKPFIIILRFE